MRKRKPENPIKVRPGFAAWLGPISVSAIGLLSAVWLTLFSGLGQAGQPVALVFPPNWDRLKVFLSAADLNVDVVDVKTSGFVAIVIPRTNSALDRYRQSGAIFAIAAPANSLCQLSVGNAS